jgi:hypothetical protein
MSHFGNQSLNFRARLAIREAHALFVSFLTRVAPIVLLLACPVSKPSTPQDASPSSSSDASAPASQNQSTIPCSEITSPVPFAQYNWTVQSSAVPTSPGPNAFSNCNEDVHSDHEGLHLKIVERNGTWFSTEVASDNSFGYGTYVFTLGSSVDTLDPNAVLGLFTWDASDNADNGCANANSELDIEFSMWGNSRANSLSNWLPILSPMLPILSPILNQSLKYSVQPTRQLENPDAGARVTDTYYPKFQTFAPLGFDDSGSFHSFTWSNSEVDFSSHDSNGNLQARWTYLPASGGAGTPYKSCVNATPIAIPRPTETTKVYINLYLYHGVKPAGEQDVIISNFAYYPMDAGGYDGGAADGEVVSGHDGRIGDAGLESGHDGGTSEVFADRDGRGNPDGGVGYDGSALCSPGTTQCDSTPGTFLKCSLDGEWVPMECPANTSCSDGSCLGDIAVLGDPPVYSSPAIATTSDPGVYDIYIAVGTGALYKVHADHGNKYAVVWSHAAAASGNAVDCLSVPALSKDQNTVLYVDNSGTLQAIDTGTNATRWTTAGLDCHKSIAIDDGTVYFSVDNNTLAAVNIASGIANLPWSSLGVTEAGSVSLVGNYVLVNAKTVYRVDKNTGTMMPGDNALSPSLPYTTAVSDGQSSIFVRGENMFGRIDLQTMKTIWSVPVQYVTTEQIATPLIGPGVVYVFGGGVEALDIATDNPLQPSFFGESGSVNHAGVLAGGGVWVGATEDFLYYLSSADESVWSDNLQHSDFSELMLGPDGTLFVGFLSDGGGVYAIPVSETLGSGPWPLPHHDYNNSNNASF